MEMEYYNTFIQVILKEISKFKLNPEIYSTYVSQLTAALDENFDISYNRCAYMYRYATGFTYFFNDCMKKFFASYLHTQDLFSMWKSYSEVKVCSLSVGPGLDYLAFMLAILEYDSAPENFDITIVSKYGAWRNTASLILEVFREQVFPFKVSCSKLKYQNVKVIQSTTLLKDYSTSVGFLNVSEANIILMMKTLNFLDHGSTQEAPLLQDLKEMVSSLKSETIIICIDTKPSITVFTQALSHYPGKFLYGPIHRTVQLPAVFPEVNGNHPVISVRGAFFVWQKINSPSANVCNFPTKIAEENKVDNSSNFCNSGDKCKVPPVVENATTKVESSDTDNLPWIELKSFWKCSSPKTKELLSRVMLTDEGSLDEINELITQSEKLDINKKHSLGTNQTIAKEDEKLEQNQIMSGTPQIKMQELNEDNLLKTAFENCYDPHSDNSGSPSPSDTLNSVSSFTCENNSSSKSVHQSNNLLPITSETLQIYPQSSENSINMNTKENYVNLLPSENKTIQTDTLLDIPTTRSSVKALTDKIKKLAISLQSASQYNGPSNSSGGDSFSFNQPNEEPDNHTSSTDKSSSKQSASFGCKESHSLPSYQSYRNAPCQNMVGPCNCQCSHNRCMHCHFQPCCGQPVPRCSFSFNQQQNSMGNISSPTIVIPLQNISDNAMLQIISILKSESKN